MELDMRYIDEVVAVAGFPVQTRGGHIPAVLKGTEAVRCLESGER